MPQGWKYVGHLCQHPRPRGVGRHPGGRPLRSLRRNAWATARSCHCQDRITFIMENGLCLRINGLAGLRAGSATYRPFPAGMVAYGACAAYGAYGSSPWVTASMNSTATQTPAAHSINHAKSLAFMAFLRFSSIRRADGPRQPIRYAYARGEQRQKPLSLLSPCLPVCAVVRALAGCARAQQAIKPVSRHR